MTTINITLDTKTLKTVAKKALIGLGIAGLATVGVGTAAVAQAAVETATNANIVDLNYDGTYIGNFDCEAGTYRAPVGNKLGLNPFVRYDGEELAETLYENEGMETALVGALGIGIASVQACASVPPVVPAAPVVAAPAPAPVVAAPSAEGYFGPITKEEYNADSTSLDFVIAGYNGGQNLVDFYQIDENKVALELNNGIVVTIILQGAGSSGGAWVYYSEGIGSPAYSEYDSASFWYGDNGQIVVETGNDTIFFPRFR